METAEIRNPVIDEDLKERDDFTTWAAEALDGSMRTSFEFDFDGEELYGRDGRALGPVFNDALDDARLLAARKPNLLFEYRRRKIEREEYEEIIKMARGEGPNTMVVTSDFPPELMERQQSIGGYNAKRKQTFLRVITRDVEGKITITSQSLDLSDRTGLEQIYAYFGRKAETGELLCQRIHTDLPSEEQAQLVDRLMGIYDRSLEAQYGGGWRAGRQPIDYRNTYGFVQAQTDLVDLFVRTKLHDSAQAGAMLYGIMATLQQRFDLNLGNSPLRAAIAEGSLADEIHFSSNLARARGLFFAACGFILTANGEATSEQELSKLGYGNETKEDTNYKFDKKMHCVVHDPNQTQPKVMCGPCGICKECDTKLRKK